MTNMEHMLYFEQVVQEDLAELRRKESTYMGSWKKRGGQGAYHMSARKIDRIETIVQNYAYDIFAAIEADPTGQDGSALAELRDLRRYLILIESEMLARAARLKRDFPIEVPRPNTEPNRPGTPENGGHHARLSDGLQLRDIGEELRDYYMTTTSSGRSFQIVDRRKTPLEMWEHLPRLRPELNNKEHEETPPEYQNLYAWDNTGGNKWILRKQYREHWGMEA